MTYTFDRATALEALPEGRFAGRLTRDFWIMAGPNGGYLAAIALRGARAIVSEPERVPRSLNLRYLAVAAEGEFELQASIARAGRSLTFVDLVLQQNGRVFVTGTASFAAAVEGAAFADTAMPPALPLEAAPVMPKVIPMNAQFESRLAIGERGGERASTGGYLKFADGRPIDVIALAALWDCWPPAVLFRGATQVSGAVPTVEASVFFRRSITQPVERVLLHTHSQLAHDGFMEEDGEIWSLDGSLLVQSRQLAICR